MCDETRWVMLPTKPISNVTWRDAKRHREVSTPYLAAGVLSEAPRSSRGQGVGFQGGWVGFQGVGFQGG